MTSNKGQQALLQEAVRMCFKALVKGPLSCQYHGTDFEKLGTYFDGRPRCDSCKQPWRISQALLAIERAAEAGAVSA